MKKSIGLFSLLLTLAALSAAERNAFQCNFSQGLKPQYSASPVQALTNASITTTGTGKAIRVGKKTDGSIVRLAYRLQNPSVSEDNTPFPIKCGRLTFRFKPVDWKIGSKDFNMLMFFTGPGKERVHVIYLTPKVTGKPSIQVCYGTPGLKAGTPKKVTALFPFVALDASKEWHEVEVEWNEASLNLTVDGESQLIATSILELPQSFTADMLVIGSFDRSTLAGLTDITDIRIYGDDGK